MEFPKFKKTRLSQLVAHGLIISGRGGSSSSSSSRTPVEADDTVNSRAMASVLDLLGEGVVGGLVDGAKSIFLNDTALENDDGSTNFSGVTWWFRDGSQDQSVIDGFDFIETPKSVSRQLTKSSEINVALDSADSDRLRVVMKFPSLRNIDKTTGDTNAATVKFKFQIDAGEGAGFVDVTPVDESQPTITLTAKKTGVYYRSYVISLPKPGKSYTLRAIRLSDDHPDNSYIYDDTYVDSIGEIVNTSLNYPNSALVGLKINSEQFGTSMPTRSYLIKGLKIRVPSNYDESSNTYSGNWDGTFKLASSSNPAWILFDLLTNTRYGLGEFVQESMINLGELYQIGRYCDATVDDGFGGTEKRFAINTQITSRQDAYRAVQDIAGAFRGMVYWAGGMVHVTQDSPADPVMLFSNSNVVNGAFAYKGSARKDRYSVALITYNNKDDGYKQSVEYVEDQEAIKRYGIRKTESVAFGCTSRGQAHRVGLWTLYTSRMESDVITFSVGMDSLFLMPGDIILLADKYRAGRRNSGRVMAYTANSITLDAPVDLTTVGNHITFLSSEGVMVERDILENGSAISTVTFKSALSSTETPVADSVWVIAQPDLAPMQARVVSVTEGTDGVSFNITAIQNNPTKYDAIDTGAQLIAQSTTVLDPTYSKPSNLAITEGTYLSSPGNLSVSLTAAWEGKSAEYYVSWRRSDAGNVSNWQSQRVTEEQFELKGVNENGQYDFQVYAVSVSGRKTDPISTTYQVLGTLSAPVAPSSLTAVGDYRSIVLNWVSPSSVDLDHIEVLGSQTNDSSTAQLVAKVSGTSFTHSGLDDSTTWFYWVRSVNKRGMTSSLNATSGTSATTKDVLSFLENKITSTQLSKDLTSDLDAKAEQKDVDTQIQTVTSQAQSLVQAAKDQLVAAIGKESSDRDTAVTNEAKSRAQSISDSVNAEAAARAKQITSSVLSLNNAIQQEVTDRTAALNALDSKTMTGISSESEARIAAVQAEAATRADALLQEQNTRESAISSVTAKLQTATDSLAQQISQVAAGTGDQFDSFKIWYFDTNSESWTGNGGATSVTSDGWLKMPGTSDPYATSPAGLAVNGAAYRFVKLRIKKVGSPDWAGQLRWAAAGNAFNDTNMATLPLPDFDGNGVATITYHDVLWNSITVDQIRFDLSASQDDNNYYLIDWVAIGRPTPGAGMADIANEQTARVNADAAEATQRQTLAVQLRGSYDGNDLSKVSTGLIYQEQQARITADKAEATQRESLQTSVDNSLSTLNKSLDTLNTKQSAQASDITAVKSSLSGKADTSALQTLQTQVDQQGSTLSTQSKAITELQSSLSSANSAISTKADQTALSSLQGTVTQQGTDITAANNSISKLQSSLDNTNTTVGNKADASTVSALTGRVTQAENKLDSQSSSIVQLNNSLNQMSRVGTNPWFDGSLESYSDGYQLGGANLTVSSALKYSGSLSLKASRSAGTSGNSEKMVGPLIAVRSGAIYRFELWVYMESSQAPSTGWTTVVGLNTMTKDNTMGWPGAIVVSESSLSSRDTWVKLTGTVTVPSDAVTARVWFSTRGTSGDGTPGYQIYFDGIVIADVTDAIAAQQTGNANSSALSSLQNTVTSQGNTISSQGSSITSLKNDVSTLSDGLSDKASTSALNALTNTVTNQAGTITSQGDALTSLTSRVTNTESAINKKADATALNNYYTKTQADSAAAGQISDYDASLSLGGVNLIDGSDDMSIAGTIASETLSGNKVAKVTRTSGQSGNYTDAISVATAAALSGNTYTLSFWAKADVSGAPMFCYFYSPNTTLKGVTSQGKTSTSTDGNIQFSLTTSWARYSVTWTQSDTNSVKRLVIGRLFNPGSGTVTAYLAMPQLEAGTKASDWSPSVNDVQGQITANSSAISAVKSDVSKQGDTLTSQQTALTALQAGITSGANIVPNPSMANSAAGWSGSGNGTDGSRVYAEANYDYAPNSKLFSVNPGDTLVCAADIWTDAARSVSLRLRFDGSSMTNNASTVQTQSLAASTWVTFSGSITVPTGAATAQIQVVHGSTGKARIANATIFAQAVSASAFSTLSNKVTQQGETLASQSSSITSLTNSISNLTSEKASTSALSSLSSSVTTQGTNISSQGSRISALENTVTAGENLIPNPSMLNGAAGWNFQETGSMDGFNYVRGTTGWNPSSGKFYVSPGDVIDLDFWARAEVAVTGIGWALRFDGPTYSNKTVLISKNDYAAAEHKNVTGSVVVPDGAVTAFLQPNQSTPSGNNLMLWNVNATRRSAADIANATAISTLSNTVTKQGDSLTSQSSSITSLTSSLNKRTVFTIGSWGSGAASGSLAGVYSESGTKLAGISRSWTLVVFKTNSDGSTSVSSTSSYDVYSSSANGTSLATAIKALANNTYACLISCDEPTGNRSAIVDAVELLGGTTEVVNSLPYRGAYILLGRKGMKAGDGLELRSPTGGTTDSVITTSVEFINGVMMGLGAAGGVMMKADANASAITTLQNTVTKNGTDITSTSSSLTALSNSLNQLKASGANLVIDGGFENFTTTSGNLITDGAHHSGSKSAKFRRTAATNSGGNNDMNYGGWFDIRSSQVMYVEVWARYDSASTTQAGYANVGIQWQNPAGTNSWAVAYQLAFSGLSSDNTWKKFSGYVQVGSEATRGTFWMSLPQVAANLNGASILIDDVFVCDATDGYNAQKTATAASTAVTSLTSTVTSLDSKVTSQATQLSTLTSSYNTQSSTIKQLQTTVASKEDTSATWMVKMLVNSKGEKYAAGIGLGIDGSSLQSQFLVQADRFALLNTSTSTTSTPFVIDSGSTYINTAFIKDGTIGTAKVGDLKSTNFVENSTGWRISKDGSMNINGNSGGKGRLSITNTRIDVYDDNGVLRVRIGLL